MDLEIARHATPNDAEIWDAMGAIDRRQGRWQEAIRHLEKARELDPRNTSVLWTLAESYSFHGRNEEAKRGMEEGFQVNPNAHFFPLAQAAIDLRGRLGRRNHCGRRCKRCRANSIRAER